MRARTLALLLLPALALGVGAGRRGAERRTLRLAADEAVNPMTRVVKLLEEMKAQVEAEVKEDEDIYDKMACWCETNDKEKTAAIKIAEERIQELAAAIEEGVARAAKLGTEIQGLKVDIAATQESIEAATALREREKGDFEATDKDLSESIALLRQAVQVLSKVQLVQGKGQQQQQQAGEAMMQVRSLVSRATRAAAHSSDIGSLRKKQSGVYKSVMQKDLWDLLGDMPAPEGEHVVTGLAQQPTGQAAGAKSYNARSGGILGILSTMMESFEQDLSSAQKAEIEAELSFQRLRSAKEGEMQAAGAALEEKTAELASTDQRVAESKQDIEDTKSALSADSTFLMDLKDRCSVADKAYAERSKTRMDEISAIAETIQILMEDDARDLASKTLSFLQRGALSEAARQLQQHAVSQLLAVARRHRNTAGGWRLATLAVNVQLDGFGKVKEMMDRMTAELKKQQQDEYDKHELCKSNVKSNEDATMVKQSEKQDLEALIAGLEGTMASLAQDLEDLKAKTVETRVALKTAGEERKAANREFQQVVSDQRATVAILQKALERLRKFYQPSLLAVEAAAHGRQEPGAPVEAPPPAGKDYSQSGGSGGVMQMLEKIIQDAQRADQEAVSAEQASQEAYGELVANMNAVLDATAASVNEKTDFRLKAEADLLIAKKDLATADTTLADLADQSKAYHLDCDYLLKNFNLRQQGRQEEIEAVQEAKAILSGADFGL